MPEPGPVSSPEAAAASDLRRPVLSVLVVTYRNPELTRACLASIYAQTAAVDFEVIVVDNASDDGTPELVAREFPGVRLFALAENLGFARGNNYAAERALGDWVLLLNPDTIVHDRALERLVAFAGSHPEAGACGGRTVTPAGSLDPRSCAGAPSLWGTFCFASGLSTAFKGNRVLDPESLGPWQRDSVRSVGVVVGCLLIVRRQVWLDVGGFDPAFFMYGEDVDLSIRLRRRGLDLLIDPEAQITHVVGASTRTSGAKMTMIVRSRVSVMRRHWSRPRRALGVRLLLMGAWLRATGQRLGRSRNDTWIAVWDARDEWRAGYG